MKILLIHFIEILRSKWGRNGFDGDGNGEAAGSGAGSLKNLTLFKTNDNNSVALAA